jgi:hypothetical protein
MPKYKIANEPEILKRVHVRLVESEDELSRYNELIESHHYLGNAHMAGQNLRYVAELDGEWVCLLGFSAAALHLKAREKWIRWSDRQRARRLEFVVNNSRFLVLADRHQIPNLASRVLALCLRRLSSDWEEHWDILFSWWKALSMKAFSGVFVTEPVALKRSEQPPGTAVQAGISTKNTASPNSSTSRSFGVMDEVCCGGLAGLLIWPKWKKTSLVPVR